MKSIIFLILVILIIIGGAISMPYLNEVNGKIRTKTIAIGGGYDGVNPALQVQPGLATEMLNISNDLYPNLTIRNGRNQIGYLTLNLVKNRDYIYGKIKPFVDSAGNTHFALLVHNTDTDELMMDRYILKPSVTYLEKVSAAVLSTSVNMNQAEAQRYLNVNFVETNNLVYLNYVTSDGEYLQEYYNIATADIYQQAITVDDSYNASPSAVYLNKMFVATGYPYQSGSTENVYSLAYSKTGVLYDFTTALDSGKIPLHQGGIVKCIVPMKDRLFIGTETALFVLFGNSFDSFSLSLLADNIGVHSSSSVISKNGIVYFASNTGDVYEYSGGSLVNLSREPIETGSKSAVVGGYEENSLVITSMSVETNNLRCIAYGRCYIFDLVKRRWFIQDTTNEGAVAYNDSTRSYEISEIYTDMTTYDKYELLVYQSDSGNTNNTNLTRLTAGTQEIISLTIVGTLTANNPAVMIFNDKFGAITSPYTNVGASTTATALATIFRNTLIETFASNKRYTVGGTNATITLTRNQELPNDTELAWSISGTGLTPTSFTITQNGVAPTFSSSTTKSNPIFTWTSGAIQLNPTGKQMLKAIHITYDSPVGTMLTMSTSFSLDGEDFDTACILGNSAYEQNLKKVIPFKNARLKNWIRIRFSGTGNITIYNITLEWRLLDRLR